MPIPLNGVDIDHLRGTPVFSHPQALSQCQQFIERLHLSPVPCASTRASIDQLIVEGRGVAITNSAQETDPRLQIVEREVDDLSGSITRFLLLGRADTFGHLAHGSESTLRSLWIGTSTTLILPELLHGGPAFDEILSDDAGNFLWVTGRIQVSCNRRCRVLRPCSLDSAHAARACCLFPRSLANALLGPTGVEQCQHGDLNSGHGAKLG